MSDAASAIHAGIGRFRMAVLVLCCLAVAACSHEATVYGLRPLSPPARVADGKMVVAEVNSLQPALVWTAQPVPGEMARDLLPPLTGPVTYDLRLWREAGPGQQPVLVYERTGLAGPAHRIERPLEPDTRYLWTVRAAFATDAGPRVTVWSRPLVPGVLPRPNVVPEVGRFIFRTPAR